MLCPLCGIHPCGILLYCATLMNLLGYLCIPVYVEGIQDWIVPVWCKVHTRNVLDIEWHNASVEHVGSSVQTPSTTRWDLLSLFLQAGSFSYQYNTPILNNSYYPMNSSHPWCSLLLHSLTADIIRSSSLFSSTKAWTGPWHIILWIQIYLSLNAQGQKFEGITDPRIVNNVNTAQEISAERQKISCKKWNWH